MSSSNEEEDAAPSGVPYDDKRQADLHWRQIEQLKGAAVCIRLHRNRLARQVKAVELHQGRYLERGNRRMVRLRRLQAPLGLHHRGGTASRRAERRLSIRQAAPAGRQPHGGPGVVADRRRGRKLQLEAEQKHFPEGFEPDRKIVALATEETRTYFLVTYDLEMKP